MVSKIASEMIEENRHLLLKCTGYLFWQPLTLLDLLEEMMRVSANSDDYKQLILRYYATAKQNLNYSDSCPLLEPTVLAILTDDTLKRNFVLLVRYSLYNLLSQKEEFSRHIEYYLMYIMLVNKPEVLVKFFYCQRYQLNIKHFRCFLSFLIKEEVFSKPRTLEFGKRLFLDIYDTLANNANLEQNIERQSQIPL